MLMAAAATKPLRVMDRQGREHALAPAADGTLMQALRDAGLDIAAICGGVMSCGTCHVYVDDAKRLSAPSDDEAAMIDGLVHGRAGASRLSCQLFLADLRDGQRVTVAPEE